MKIKRVQKNSDRKTSTVYYDNGEQVEYYLRGGICWPTNYEEDNAVNYGGYVILAGFDVETKEVCLLAEQPFIVVNHIVNDDGSIGEKGLPEFFNKNWSRYYASSYYWGGQHYETHKTHRLEIIRGDMFQPKPKFVHLPEFKEEDRNVLIWKYLKLQKLLGVLKDTDLYRHMERFRPDRKDFYPSIHALSCLLSGIERHPWRMPRG